MSTWRVRVMWNEIENVIKCCGNRMVDDRKLWWGVKKDRAARERESDRERAKREERERCRVLVWRSCQCNYLLWFGLVFVVSFLSCLNWLMLWLSMFAWTSLSFGTHNLRDILCSKFQNQHYVVIRFAVSHVWRWCVMLVLGYVLVM